MTKKDLLEAIEDMPDGAEVWIETEQTLERITKIYYDKEENDIIIKIC